MIFPSMHDGAPIDLLRFPRDTTVTGQPAQCQVTVPSLTNKFQDEHGAVSRDECTVCISPYTLVVRSSTYSQGHAAIAASSVDHPTGLFYRVKIEGTM